MKWRTRNVIVLVLFFTYFLILNIIHSSKATGADYTALYRSGVGPTIDGSIRTSEWINANKSSVIFQFNDTENPFIEVDLYLLHNGTALFIGINVTVADQYNDTDAFYIYFDEDHNEQLDGNNTNPNEEGLQLYRDGTYLDLCYNGSKWINDIDKENLTQGPSFGAVAGNEWEFIFWTSNNASDFDVNLPSNVVERAVEMGFNIEYYDADIDQYDSFTTTNNKTVNGTPSVWDDLICDIVPVSPPNLIAIWTFIIITMIIPAGLIVYIIIWLMRRKLN